jgi:dipeptidase E
MTLLLASDLSFLLKYGYELTGIPKDEIKIGYITTAAKGSRNFYRRVEDINMPSMKEAGYLFEEIDIVGKTENELRAFFKDKNIIQVEGGNTFYLLKAIRETGFGQILKELIAEGKIYLGTSAGSYIMGVTIDVSDWNDATVDRNGVSDFTALNYVPFLLMAHYKDEKRDFVKEKMKNLKYPLRILRDGQGIFCKNGTCEFIGEEVVLN